MRVRVSVFLCLNVYTRAILEQASRFAHVPSVCVADLSVLTLRPMASSSAPMERDTDTPRSQEATRRSTTDVKPARITISGKDFHMPKRELAAETARDQLLLDGIPKGLPVAEAKEAVEAIKKKRQEELSQGTTEPGCLSTESKRARIKISDKDLRMPERESAAEAALDQ